MSCVTRSQGRAWPKCRMVACNHSGMSWTTSIVGIPRPRIATPRTTWKRCRAPRGTRAHLFALFRPHVGRRVLEVGCGIGTMSESLAAVADVVVGIEPNPACAVQVREHMRGEPKFSLRECLIEECDPAELAVAPLRHRVLRERARAHRRRRRGAAHVPTRWCRAATCWCGCRAVPAAYGPLDAELGHHRRYTQGVADAGLRARRDSTSCRCATPTRSG